MTESILLLAGRAETDALAKAITSLRAEPHGPERLAEQLDLLAARCLTYPAETRQLWDWFERQEPCMETGELIAVCEDHLSLIDRRIGIVQEAQALAAVGRSSHEAALAAALADLSAHRGHIAGFVEQLNAPMPPWTGPEIPKMPKMTREEVLAAIERGEFEDIETILERVRNGGPVSKD